MKLMTFKSGRARSVFRTCRVMACSSLVMRGKWIYDEGENEIGDEVSQNARLDKRDLL